MVIRDLPRVLYARRLRSQVSDGPLPAHVAVVMDGNRRWARQAGLANPSVGHDHGARHISDLLRWCADVGIHHVTVFVASTDNLTARPTGEIDHLMRVVEDILTKDLTTHPHRWQVHVAGTLGLLPDTTADALDATRDVTTGAHITLAVGYGGREEIADALRRVLTEQAATGATLHHLAATLTVDDLATRLYTAGQPHPDLVIRTSGEQRLSGFLLWQSAYSDLYFCDANWPAFRHVDFLRALRSYARRHRATDR